MRVTAIALILMALSRLAAAQESTIAAPTAGVANYDPTMSAKEAVLANWELAASGIRAGKIVGRQVVAKADEDVPYDKLAQQALFAQKTMLQRYNAALWIYAPGSGVERQTSNALLAAAVRAAMTPCARTECATERRAIQTSFAEATDQLDRAAKAAREALTARENLADRGLMSEQLTLVAAYLESGTWGENFALTEFGRDGEEVAARIVGAMALWKNLEPYVGLADPDIDKAINTAARELLRTLRQETRGAETLAPDGPELTAIRARTETLAAEFRRAAALFSA